MIGMFLQKSVNCIPWSVRSGIKHIPLVAPLQRWLIERFLSNREFLHTINAGPAKGLRYPVRMPEDKAIWTGAYEIAFSDALASCVKPSAVCFDVGGFRGFFSGLFAMRGAGKVFTFEPLPANVRQIRAMISANPGLPIELREVAVGAEAGTATFEIMPEASMGKLTSSSFQPDQHGKNTVVVRVEALDELIDSGTVPQPDLIKIDVEGAEALVLAGARTSLARCKPTLFIEIHTRQLGRECHAILSGLGYEVSVLETAQRPDFQTDPEVCHFVAHAR